MHVLLLPTWYVTPERPDLGIYFREHALALARSGYQTGVLYVDFGLGDLWKKLTNGRPFQRSYYMDQGVATLRVDALGFPKRMAWSQDLYVQLVLHYYQQYCRQFGRPDIIHAQGYTAGFAASRIKQRWQVPFVYSEHISSLKDHQYPAAHRRMLEAAVSQAAAITAVSSALAGWMRALTDRTIQVIPNLVDTELFRPDPSRKADTFTLLYVGDLIPLKAPDLLLRAFFNFLSRIKPRKARLVFVGKGSLRVVLESLATELGISTAVDFQGLLPAAAVVQHMQAAHCLVLSSLTETFGVVQTEAMACGLPVIATACGGPVDIVTAGTGLLVEVGNEEALTTALCRVFEHPEYYDPGFIRAWAIEKFGVEKVVEQWEILYSEIVVSSNV